MPRPFLLAPSDSLRGADGASPEISVKWIVGYFRLPVKRISDASDCEPGRRGGFAQRDGRWQIENEQRKEAGMACRCAVALWAFFAAVPAAADDLGPQSTGGDFAAATTEEKADYAARIAKAAAGDADALSDKVLAATALLSCLQKTIGPTPPPALARERLPFIALLCMAKR